LDGPSRVRDALQVYVVQHLSDPDGVAVLDSCGVGSYVESLGFAFGIAKQPTDSASSDST
jgi:hypothetical protein